MAGHGVVDDLPAVVGPLGRLPAHRCAGVVGRLLLAATAPDTRGRLGWPGRRPLHGRLRYAAGRNAAAAHGLRPACEEPASLAAPAAQARSSRLGRLERGDPPAAGTRGGRSPQRIRWPRVRGLRGGGSARKRRAGRKRCDCEVTEARWDAEPPAFHWGETLPSRLGALSMLGRTALGLPRAESTVSPELKQIKRARGLGTAARLFVASGFSWLCQCPCCPQPKLQLEGQQALAAEPDCLTLVLKKRLHLFPLKLRGSHTHDSREVK